MSHKKADGGTDDADRLQGCFVTIRISDTSERVYDMAEHNNELADRLPKTPNPALKQFERLIGTWRISGPDVTGTVRYEWMEGGFFLIQHFDLIQGGEHYKCLSVN